VNGKPTVLLYRKNCDPMGDFGENNLCIRKQIVIPKDGGDTYNYRALTPIQFGVLVGAHNTCRVGDLRNAVSLKTVELK
jgi:hypothetical protein